MDNLKWEEGDGVRYVQFSRFEDSNYRVEIDHYNEGWFDASRGEYFLTREAAMLRVEELVKHDKNCRVVDLNYPDREGPRDD